MAIVTSPYELKILEWDDTSHKQTNKTSSLNRYVDVRCSNPVQGRPKLLKQRVTVPSSIKPSMLNGHEHRANV